MKNQDVQEFKNSLLGLRTRKLWEASTAIIHRLVPKKKGMMTRCSVLRKRLTYKIDSNNLVNSIVECNKDTGVLFESELTSNNFDIAVQQLKMGTFNKLYVLLLLEDVALLLSYNNDTIKMLSGFCNFQHSNNSDEAQFHLNQTNIEYHIEEHMVEKYTYEELYDNLVD